jgi:hypothetical protein
LSYHAKVVIGLGALALGVVSPLANDGWTIGEAGICAGAGFLLRPLFQQNRCRLVRGLRDSNPDEISSYELVFWHCHGPNRTCMAGLNIGIAGPVPSRLGLLPSRSMRRFLVLSATACGRDTGFGGQHARAYVACDHLVCIGHPACDCISISKKTT